MKFFLALSGVLLKRMNCCGLVDSGVASRAARPWNGLGRIREPVKLGRALTEGGDEVFCLVGEVMEMEKSGRWKYDGRLLLGWVLEEDLFGDGLIVA